MQLKVSVVSDRPDEYIGKKGLVKQQVITCQDVDPDWLDKAIRIVEKQIQEMNKRQRGKDLEAPVTPFAQTTRGSLGMAITS